MAVIEAHNLVKTFGDKKAVDKLSFSIEKNKIYGLLGSNGAGKTTTINMLTGLLLPNSGNIRILNLNTKTNIEEIREKIALVPQTLSLYESLTVYENIEFFAGMHNIKNIKKQVEKITKTLGLTKVNNQKISELSGGYKRRCSIAAALVSNPKILFLDEPLTGIDIQTNQIIINHIKSIKDLTVVITTHSIDEAEALCDEIIYLNKGKKILCGSVKKIKQKYATKIGEKITINFKQNHKIKGIKGNKITLRTKNTGSSVIEILSKYNKHKSKISNIDIEKPSLKKIIQNITKK